MLTPVPIPSLRIRPPEPRTPLPQYRGDFSSFLELLRKALSKTGEDIPVSAADPTTIAQVILGLAAKALNPTAGNFAALDADGNLVDSGKKPSDFQAKLTFDTTPTAGSQNPVTSEGVKNAIMDAQGGIADIRAVIPTQASEQNQLADKAFVNSSIATNTAFYISDGGRPFQSLADLENYEGALTNNDYAFVVGRDAAGNTTYTRYKWNDATETWGEEYVLNNSSFTAEQWAAISSGITSGLVAKIGALPTAEALAAALAGKASKADATLTPIYSDTPTFSEWTFDGTEAGLGYHWEVEWDSGDEMFYLYRVADSDSSQKRHVASGGEPGNTVVNFGFPGGDVTATRTRTDIIGYQLGSQSDKPLQPKGDYPTRSDIDAGWWSEWTVEFLYESSGWVGIDDPRVQEEITSASLAYDDNDGWRLMLNLVGGRRIIKLPPSADARNENATRLGFSLLSENDAIRATRHRVAAPVPTKPEDIGAQPAGNYAPATNITKSALAQDVQASLGKADTALQTAPVTSVNGKTGAVSLSASDVGAVPKTGGRMTGDLTITTALWLHYLNSSEFGGDLFRFKRFDDAADEPYDVMRREDLALKAPLASPAFTGTPTAPTPTTGDNSTKVATTAFVAGAVSGKANKVANATAGNLATLDANGNPTDSQIPAASVAVKSDLRYSFNAATVSSGTTPTVTDLADRAINTATLGSSVTAATVTLPAATANRARDFFIDLTIEATTAPTLTFIDPATNTTANVTYGADSLADIDTGRNAVLFTEFPNYTWIVSVKHEEVSA